MAGSRSMAERPARAAFRRATGSDMGALRAQTALSESMMMISMLANRLLLVWMIVVGVLMWRRVDKEHLGNSVA